MPQPLIWTQLKCEGEVPTARYGHTLTKVGNYFILFGGVDGTKDKKDQKIIPTNDVYVCTATTKDLRWTKKTCTGDIPLPRAQHIAIELDKDNLLIFGGVYNSRARLNDVVILNIVNWTWKVPPGHTRLTDPKNEPSSINGPDPRGSCGACIYNKKLYISGGLGGSYFTKRVFNDLYELDLTTYKWSPVEYKPAGRPPDPRCGHSMFVKEGKFYIYGGWNNESQYNTMSEFSFEKFDWSDIETITNSPPRWNHAGLMVESIPSQKYFLYGGMITSEGGEARGVGDLSSQIYYLDMKKFTWEEIKTEDEKKVPPSREHTALVYDKKDSRIILFGGWHNNFMNDAYALNISTIVGPPYAIESIEPAMGQLSGGTKVIIKGMRFYDAPNIMVSYKYGKQGPPDVPGIYISETEIGCTTPNFDVYGPKEVDVRLKFKDSDYTITSSKFTYFMNTRANKCLAYGPGLLEGGKAGEDIYFLIQARNELGENRKSGKDKFEVLITQESVDGVIPASIEDKDDGTYLVKYKVEKPNKANIVINFENDKQKMEAIRGSPFKASYLAEAPPNSNLMTGPLMISSTTKEIGEIEAFLKETIEGSSIKGKPINDDVKVLLKVQENIQNSDEKSSEVQLKLDIIDIALQMLEKANINKVSEIKKLQNLRDSLSLLHKQIKEVRREIEKPFAVQSELCGKTIKEFEDKTKSFLTEIKKTDFCTYNYGVVNSFKKIEEIKEIIKQHEGTLKDLTYNAVMFKFPTAVENAQKNVDQAKIDIENIRSLWDHIKHSSETFDSFLSTPWNKTQANEMEEDVKKLFKKLKNEIKVDPKLNVYIGINDLLKKWTNFLPLVTELRDEAMRPRHWEKLMKIIAKNIEINEKTLLRDMWDLDINKFKDDVEGIGDQAKQEAKMEKTLDKLEVTWKTVNFDLVPYKTSGINTLKMNEDNFEMLEEHQVAVQNMFGSKFLAFFEERVVFWQKSLAAVSEVVQLLAEVQRLWSFLENLFIHSEEVKKELPKEAEQFIGIDKTVKEILKNGESKKNIYQVCNEKDIMKQLEDVQKQLGVCEKALNDFLDGKRRAFPRFYFVSPSDLLDILANGNNPQRIQMHMPKVFQAIDRLELKETPDSRPSAVGMHANIGTEYVQFDVPLKLDGKVERYLDETIKTMRNSLRKICGTSVEAGKRLKRAEWLIIDPAQITMIVNQMMWVNMVEDTFLSIQNGTANAMKDAYVRQVDNLNLLIKMVQGQLEKSLRQKVMVMITMDTHNRDMIDKLNKEGVKKSDEFQWQAQLKHVWDVANSTCRIDIVDAKFIYAYEYYGNCPRLVITPLTDRIYVTAAQALNLKMGCAPAGPAGTGKTETVKDLSSANAKPCYVYNCSPEMDYRGMGNIYKGLAASGAWGCFDEFNRLILEVLSVCSVQFKAVIDAIKAKKERFTLQGDEIDLDPTCGVFITMNPGYLGRSELPESLKTLFRPITVVVPDFELICENMLMAEGFLEAKDLAHKFICLYALCRDLLSKQTHYDWGMRAIKSVLVVAGGFKRAESELAESKLLMRALRDFNLPKIVSDDLDIFMGLLGDLFPGLEVPRKRDMKFEDIIVEAAKEQKYYPDPQFVLKIVQLYELLEIRHCVFIMGLYGSGKSATWKTLAKAQDKAGKKTTYIDINPKSINTNELYGFLLPTKEWKDGVMSKNLRDLGRVADSNPKWIVLDGDIDANWIESMNSVMDDNKMLTLASNERIPLKAHMRMLFEIRDLLFASPATVSRAGILYISDPGGYQWKAYIKSWLSIRETQADKEAKDKDKEMTLEKLFEKYMSPTLDELKKHYKFVMPVMDISLVAALCKMLEGLVTPDTKNLEYIFVFALVWAVGAGLCEKDGIEYKKNFSSWFKNTFKTVRFPSTGTIFDYFVEKDKSNMEEWSKQVKSEIYDDITPISDITIETTDSVSSTYFMEMLVKVGHFPLLVGNAGCGKTAICKGLLNKLQTLYSDKFIYNTINFNYYTDSPLLQPLLEKPLEKKAGVHYGPPGKLKLIYYIDDLNMPMVDIYNTQTAIELMRQYADYNHWFDRSKLTLKKITDALFLASMNPTAGSLYINPRMQRHFWLLNIQFPEQSSLYVIYNTFMSGHFKKFKPVIQEQISLLIKTALNLHASIATTFRKTAINFHYDFNIRHIANIFQGLMNATPEKFTDPEKLIKLWIHESNRIYGDRLVTEDNLKVYKEMIGDIAKKAFPKYGLTKYFTKTATTNSELLVFTNFANGNTDRSYDQILTFDSMSTILINCLNEYNETNPAMDLVLFEDAMKHVCRIARIINNNCGHALLVGVGGSGKQSLSKLASYICQYTTVGIMISSTYGMNDLKTDLQNFFKKAGEKDEGLMFLFTDGQISNEKFLVYINDLLSSGEIADLFTTEEKDNIINVIRPAVKNAGIQDSRDNCWNYYIKRIKRNLHMVICFSPVGDYFRTRARKFPALINSTVIDWFQKWPKDALQKVSAKFLDKEDMPSQDIKNAVIEFMPTSFDAVNEYSQKILEAEKRYIYTTPKSFLELIKLFKTMYENRRKTLEDSKQRYEDGVIKLKNTGEDVAKLELELKDKSVEVEAAKKEAVEQAAIVTKEKINVEGENQKAEIEAQECAKIQKFVEEKKASVQKDLDEAEPLVKNAEAALKGVNIDDFRNLKALANPPQGTKDMFSCLVNILAGVDKGEKTQLVEVDKNGRPKDVSWNAAKKTMANPQHLVEKLAIIKSLVDTNSIPVQNFNANKGLMGQETFTKETFEKISSMMVGLYNWLSNITKYFEVFTSIEPKRIAVREATEQLKAANERKAVVDAQVAELRAKLKILEDQYATTIAAKEKAEAEANKCQQRLTMAQRLIKALGSENERWTLSIGVVTEKIGLLVGDVLISSAFVSYIGPFTKKYRIEIIKNKFMDYMIKTKIPMSPDPNPLSILASDAEMAMWNNQKLPSDRVSLENGAILVNSERYALMIDPQLQGITWVKEKEKVHSLRVVRLGTKELIRALESSIESGNTVLIENMDEQIDAFLMPVICRNTIKRGPSRYLKLGDKELCLNKDFRLFMHTKLSNPHYPPEIQAEATLINFSVTEEGLEDQLLNLVVRKERPDLAKQKEELIQQQNEFKIKLSDLEKDLLFQLTNAQGDILENVVLVTNLENSKKLSEEIKIKVEIAKETTTQINKIAENYRPAGSRGALLFFLMCDLAKVHSFYMYSLESLVSVVTKAIDLVQNENKKKDEPKKEEGKEEKKEGEVVKPPEEETVEIDPKLLPKRVEAISESITSCAWTFIRRGLFEKHKLLVATLLSFRILTRAGKLNQEEVDHLISGKIATEVPKQNENLKFLPDIVWAQCKALEGIFPNLCQFMETEYMQWKKWFTEEKAEIGELPKSVKSQTADLFKRILLLRAMRPDRITYALKEYIKETMGEKYVESPPFDMEETYKDSARKTPLFFVLFPGVDPTAEVEKLGQRIGISLLNISMGQGQEEYALSSMEAAAKNGTWVFMQNVHLMQTWLKAFERKLELVSEGAKTTFRCYISSEPPPIPLLKIIPESILQNCIKIANEAAQDLKGNMRNSFAKFDEERFKKSSKPTEFKALLFALCVYHSLILGRRKFGSLGWSRMYNFNDGDLNICSNVLQNYLEKYEKVPYEDLRYIFGEIMYGGHITDEWDRRTNSTYLKVLIRPELLTGMTLCPPSFKSPDPTKFEREQYRRYIEEKLPAESPQLFYMHANAEINFLTDQCVTLFDTILEISGGGSGGSVSKNKDEGIKLKITEFLAKLPKSFMLSELGAKVKEKTPYIVVCLQECERMNILLGEIRKSLTELDAGFKGQLNITDAMESLSFCLSIGKVSPTWEKFAYASKKGLDMWFADLVKRYAQLEKWSANLENPKILKSMWISGLFNPMSYLTAIMQVTARESKLPLDSMCLQNEVLNYYEDELASVIDAKAGQYIHGLYLEGGKWEIGKENEQGYLTEMDPKVLHPQVPIMNITAITVSKKILVGMYNCPIFFTSARGATFVSNTNLKMESDDFDSNIWVLRGVALLMSND